MTRIHPHIRSAATALLILLGGCYHYRITAPQPNPETEPRRTVVHNFAWGLLSNPPAYRAANCDNANALDQVRVNNNLGFTLVTVLSLGLWAPVELEWRCAKRQQQTGDLGLSPAPATEGTR
ncbi:MAG TPA: hypothetical protein VFX98_13020 [Longimicrobiaceae bacterium]|nr:hypothetical protein [Longimicrobiaceae bacterium]